MPASTDRTILLRLELAAGADPIHGSLTDESGTQIAFAGWLAFAAAVERALASSPPHTRHPKENSCATPESPPS